MNNKNELPLVLYRFEHPKDRDVFVDNFQRYFELLICETDEEAKQYLNSEGTKLSALVIDQDAICSPLPSLCKSIKPSILSIRLHHDIALDAIVSLLDSGMTDKCFAKPYDSNIIQSEIYTSSIGVNTTALVRTKGERLNERYSALIVDDEKIATKFLVKQLNRLDCPCDILVADNAEIALKLFDEHKDELAIIISDQRMPGIQGNQLLSEIQKYSPHVIRMLTSAYEEVDIALNAVNEGQIYRYIKKPWDAEEINSIIKVALFEFQSRMSRASHEQSALSSQYQQIVADRKNSLDAALRDPVDNYAGNGTLDSFFQSILSVSTLPSSSTALRLSQETNFEDNLVSAFSALVRDRVQKISCMQSNKWTIEQYSSHITDALENTNDIDATNTEDLNFEMLVCLKQLLTASGLDFSAMELINNESGLLLRTRNDKKFALYKHVLSAHTKIAKQMLQQQCEMLALILVCKALSLNLQILARDQGFSLSIEYLNK